MRYVFMLTMVFLVMLSVSVSAYNQGTYEYKDAKTGEIIKVPVTVDKDNVVVIKPQNLPRIKREPSSINEDKYKFVTKSWTQRAFDGSLQKYH